VIIPVDSVLNLIGNTPIVKLKKMPASGSAEVLVKLEKFNPGGSVKDRPALYMIEEAEKRGLLTKEKILIEPTSGNTGIGLALVSSVKGYKFVAVMPESASIERRQIMQALGAGVVLTPADKGTDGAIEKTKEMLEKEPEKYFSPDQFGNDANVKSHYETTGVEIWEQTQGKVDAFVAGMGTGGTLMGVGKRLKEYNKDIQIIGVEPVAGHKLQGLKNMTESLKPKIFDKEKLDKVVIVNDQQACMTARMLVDREGLLLGMSSGAAVFVALRIAKELGEGKTVVVLAADGGERYMSTCLFNK